MHGTIEGVLGAWHHGGTPQALPRRLRRRCGWRRCWAAAVVAVEAAGVVSVFPGRVVVLGLGDVAAVDFSSFLYCREAVSLRL